MLPQCLAIGFTEVQFWRSNPKKLHPFLLAENIKREEKNYMAWLSGMYVYSAVSTALANAFRGKGKKALDYLEKPIRITPYTEEEKAEMTEKERSKAIAFFTAMETSYNSKQKTL